MPSNSPKLMPSMGMGSSHKSLLPRPLSKAVIRSGRLSQSSWPMSPSSKALSFSLGSSESDQSLALAERSR